VPRNHNRAFDFEGRRQLAGFDAEAAGQDGVFADLRDARLLGVYGVYPGLYLRQYDWVLR